MILKNNILQLDHTSFHKNRIVSIEVSSSFTYDNFIYDDKEYFFRPGYGNIDFQSSDTGNYNSVDFYHIYRNEKKESKHYLYDRMIEKFHEKKRPGVCKITITYYLEHGYKDYSYEYFNILEKDDDIFSILKEKEKEVQEKYQEKLFSDSNSNRTYIN